MTFKTAEEAIKSTNDAIERRLAGKKKLISIPTYKINEKSGTYSSVANHVLIRGKVRFIVPGSPDEKWYISKEVTNPTFVDTAVLANDALLHFGSVKKMNLIGVIKHWKNDGITHAGFDLW